MNRVKEAVAQYFSNEMEKEVFLTKRQYFTKDQLEYLKQKDVDLKNQIQLGKAKTIRDLVDVQLMERQGTKKSIQEFLRNDPLVTGHQMPGFSSQEYLQSQGYTKQDTFKNVPWEKKKRMHGVKTSCNSQFRYTSPDFSAFDVEADQ